jgi:hypothetical protein
MAAAELHDQKPPRQTPADDGRTIGKGAVPMTQPMITDEMLRAALAAMHSDHYQGFSTPDQARTKWGAPHYIRDLKRPPGQQEIWRGDSHDEMMERIALERMRLALAAAFAHGERGNENG